MLRNLLLIGCAQMFAAAVSAQVQRMWLTHGRPDPNHVVVNWETVRPGNSVVRYGPTPELGESRIMDENMTLHHVEIPLTHEVPRWYYSVQSGIDRSPVASFKGYPYLNTSVNGGGDRYPDPKSAFLAGRDNYVLLTFHRKPSELVIDLKALDSTVLDRTRYTGRIQPAGRQAVP